ncbi:penicillin amidase [Microlunatus endophyticus]|uniref:Penicillin amidase n=1 Tax=Microlunatus endophyticus TaxID=1716077 RepID=A0A917S5T9_9ACTN|nr:penicillin amidase [Microlunatus endophyticus]
MLFVVFVLVLIVGALSSLAVTTVRSSYPQTSGEISISGLDAPVRVVRNSYGVADIYASNADDLFEAQGYVQAQERFWEMDFRRHITAGRLSELFGPSQLQTDEVIRTMGWRRVAQQEVAELSPTSRGYLDAYSDGVNAYLRTHKASTISLEYNVLGLTGLNYQPEEWSAVDSVSWLKAMAWDLSANKDQEIERALLTPKYGAAEVAELFPDYAGSEYGAGGRDQPIVGQGTVKGGAFDPDPAGGSARPAPLTSPQLHDASGELEQTARDIDSIPALVGDGGADLGVGSNSWVVSGSRTTTGKAILSNDPHLATSIPSVFEQMGLHCTTITPQCPYDVSGYTFSGMPGVVIGHNEQISWGLTTSYADVEDLYLEQVRGNEVRVGDSWQPLTVRTEEIKIKGEAPHKITIRQSRHGPLLSDVDDQYARVGRQAGVSYAVALAWTALRPGRTMEAIFGLDKATNFQQFRNAAKLLAAPSQNLLYADRSGNIGYQLPGEIPIRGKGDGSMPVPGWDSSYDWKGMIKFDELPYSYNPPDGYLVAANQPIIKNYPYPLSDGESYGWRSQELVDRITHAGKISPATAESFFYDDKVPYADALLPGLLDVKITDPWVAQGQQVLRAWNGHSDANSAGAAFFYIVMRDLLQKTFDDQLPADLQPSSGDTWYAVLAELMKKPDDPWWDDTRTKGVKETRDDIITSAIYQARKDITALRSQDPSGWSWGSLHTITLKHQAFGDVSPISRLFNRGDYPAPGGPAVVDALSFDDRTSFAVTNGPTMRMLINWADVDDSRWINQSGNSGHAFDKNYDDQLPLWATNKTLPFRFTRAAVAKNAADTLTLRPSS